MALNMVQMRAARVFGIKFCSIAIVFAVSACISSYDGRRNNHNKTWFEKGGQVYGAKPDNNGPIGGGSGYKKILLEGQYDVKNFDGLVEALKNAKMGDIIFVDGDAEINVTDLVFTEKFFFKIRGGLTLASNRGHKDSEGAIIKSDNFGTSPLLNVLGPNVRITGLRIIGPDPKPRLEHHKRSFKPTRGDRKAQHHYYYLFPNSTGIQTEHGSLEVDNCELSGWSHAAISLKGGNKHHIHHNYIHHNRRQGLGYGVGIGNGKNISALIEFNLFNYNRHSISGTGVPGNSYEARNNIQLGYSLMHHFDMHGGAARRDGTNIAGKRIYIHHNAYMDRRVRPISIGGTPVEEAKIYNNWFGQDKPSEGVLRPWPPGPDKHVFLHNNAFGRPNPVIFK